jgi:hypothetical protein
MRPVGADEDRRRTGRTNGDLGHTQELGLSSRICNSLPANPEIGVSAKAASSMNMRLSTCSFAPNEVRQSDSEPRPDKLSRAKSTRR